METITDPELRLLVMGCSSPDAGERSRAVDRIVCEFRRLVFWVAFEVLGNRHDADDVCQELFLRVIRGARPEGDTRQDWTRWLACAAHNRSLSLRQSDGQRKRREERYAAARPTAETADPLETLCRAEAEVAVRAAAERLSPEQRLVVLLRHAGLTLPEIAEQLDLPLSTVGARLRAALRELRELLRDGATDWTTDRRSA